jgi:AcrR family transcriptional regulator
MARPDDPTRARVYDAATRLLKGRPSSEVGLRSIADASGITAGRIVQLFGGKDELVFAVRLGELTERIHLDVASVSGQAPDRRRLFAFLHRHVEHALANPWIRRDLHEGAWRWTPAQQRAFDEATSPVDQLVRQTCMTEAWSPGRIDERALDGAVWMARAAFDRVLHRAVVLGSSATATLSGMQSLIEYIIRCVASAGL